MERKINFEERYVDSCRAVKDLKRRWDGDGVVANLKNFGVDLGEEVQIKELPGPVARKIAQQELYQAATRGSHEEIEQLLRYGVDNDTVLYHNYEDRCVVDIAILSGNLGAVRALAKSGCNLLHTSREGQDPLRLAFGRGYHDIVTMLIAEFSLDPFQKDKFGMSLFDVFVANKCVTNPRSGNMIKSAEALLRAILKHRKAREHINLVSSLGRTPLMSALANSSPHMADILLDHGACVTLRPDEEGDNCLSLVTFLPKNKRLVRRIIGNIKEDHKRVYGDDPDNCHEQLQVYFHTRLISQSSLSVPEFIILNHAILKKNPEIADIFEEHFADPYFVKHDRKNSNVLLLIASSELNYPIFIRILRAGADPNGEDGIQVARQISSTRSFQKDKRLLKAGLEMGAFSNRVIEGILHPEHVGSYRIDLEAVEWMETSIRAVRPLKCLIRNFLRTQPKVKRQLIFHAKQLHLPKAWLDFLDYQDLMDGQDFMLGDNINSSFPEELEGRANFRYLVSRIS